MSMCVVDGKACQCQPSEGFPCRGVVALTARVKVLEDALEQCLDDMDDGHSVCEATKQYARAALEDGR